MDNKNFTIKSTNGDIRIFDLDSIMSMSYSNASCSSSELSLGYTNCGEFDINIANFNGENDDFLFNDGEITCEYGVFKISTVIKKNGTINITSYDKMLNFDTTFIGAVFPLTVYDLLIKICKDNNVVLKNKSILNGDYIIPDGDAFDGQKCRDIVSWISEFACSYAIMNKDGLLEFKFYDINGTNLDTIPYKDFIKLDIDEADSKFTGVSLQKEKNSRRHCIGTTEYDLYLNDNNPLFFMLDDTELDTVMTSIYDIVKFLTFSTGSMEINLNDHKNMFLGNVFYFFDKKGNKHKGIVNDFSVKDIVVGNIKSIGQNKTRGAKSKGSSSGSGTGSGDTIGFTLNELQRNTIARNGITNLNNESLYDCESNKSCAYVDFCFSYTPNFSGSFMLEIFQNNVKIKEIHTLAIENVKLSNNYGFITKSLFEGTNTFTTRINLDDETNNKAIIINKNEAILSIISKNSTVNDNNYPKIDFTDSINATAVTFIKKETANTKDFNVNVGTNTKDSTTV